ncbi:MAG: DUF5666 domain-containing protein [Acidiferrobacterales bacterium]
MKNHLPQVGKGAAAIFAGMMFIFGSIAFAAGDMPGTDPGGGIGGTGITGFGVVQRFGSIFVNGREYVLNRGTRVTRNGQLSGLQALRLGQVVEVHGSIDHRSSRSAADSVAIRTSLQGRVEAIDLATARFRLLGQTVRVSSATFGGGLPGDRMNLARIQVGEAVKVSGLRDATGTWIATRVTMVSRADPGNFLVRGAVRAVNRAKGEIRIDNQVFRVDPHLLERLVLGEQVVVTGSYRGELPVVESLNHDLSLLGKVGDLVEMSGYVQRQPVPGEVVSNDVTLHYSRDATVVGGAAANIKPGVGIGIAGQIQFDGSIAVREIMVNIDPMSVTISRLSLPMPGTVKPEGRSGGNGNPERDSRVNDSREGIQRPDIERPEVEKPEIERPDIRVPEVDN